MIIYFRFSCFLLKIQIFLIKINKQQVISFFLDRYSETLELSWNIEPNRIELNRTEPNRIESNRIESNSIELVRSNRTEF